MPHVHLCIKSLLTSGVRELLSSFPAVWTNAGVFFVFVQAGFAVDPPTACYLVWGGGYMKADLKYQFVWWRLHKLAVTVSAGSVGSIGSHLLATHAEAKWHVSRQHIIQMTFTWISHLSVCVVTVIHASQL